MLRFILGVAGTGKTRRMLDELQARAVAGQHSVWLVPEQFSSAAEGIVWHLLGDALSDYAQVLSFRTLAERVLKTSGGLALPVLTDAGRVVVVRRALNAVGERLRVYGRQRHSTAFSDLCAQTLAELKTAGATPEVLAAVAGAGGDAKFHDLSLILAAYEVCNAGQCLDTEDRLRQAAGMAGCGWFAGKALYVDSFDGFTAPEYALLGAAMPLCEEMTVALCCPGLWQAHEADDAQTAARSADAPDLFAPVRRAAHRLRRLAADCGVPVAAPLLCERPLRPLSPPLARLNALLALGEDDAPGTPGTPGEDAGEAALTLTDAEDEWEEVRLVAAQMRRLALRGVPYRRMAVVCRDMEAYRRVVQRQFALYDIPLFIDATDTIEYTAPVVFLRAALKLLQRGLNYRGVLELLKTGLCGVAAHHLAAFENYLFIWQPRAAELRAPFAQNPDGLLAVRDAQSDAQLAMAEAVRARAVPVIEKFIHGAKEGTALQLSKQLYYLLDAFDAGEHNEAAAHRLEAAKDLPGAERSRRAWDLTMDLMDEMVRLVGDERLPVGGYDDFFLLLVRGTDFGSTPQTLECALFTTADRMRLDEPDHCFLVGLCAGEFPMQVGYSGLLNHRDRESLVAQGVEMPGSYENRTLLEDLFFYRATCAPRRCLHLSWPRRRAGLAKTPSPALAAIVRAFAPGPLALPDTALAATPAAAFDLLCAQYQDATPLAAGAAQALARWPDAGRWLQTLRAADNRPDFYVRDSEALARLLGERLNLSPTVVERYYACRFAYYLERVLRVRERRPAKVSPLESGTFVHTILEKTLAEAGQAFKHYTNAQLEEAGRRHAEGFITAALPPGSHRDKWRLSQIIDATVRLLCYLRDGAGQSAFEIDAVELAVGGAGADVPPLEMETKEGRRVALSGKIDRVDVLRREDGDTLCVLDYKTGEKKFELGDVPYGRNMQMLVYMDALCKNGGSRYQNPQPGAVLYLASDPAPQSGSRAGGEASPWRLDGLVLDDTAVLEALDAEGEGVYSPVRRLASDAPRKSAALATRQDMADALRLAETLCEKMAQGVYTGDFAARPTVKDEQRPCGYCPYRAVCRHEDGRDETVIGDKRARGEADA